MAAVALSAWAVVFALVVAAIAVRRRSRAKVADLKAEDRAKREAAIRLRAHNRDLVLRHDLKTFVEETRARQQAGIR